MEAPKLLIPVGIASAALVGVLLAILGPESAPQPLPEVDQHSQVPTTTRTSSGHTSDRIRHSAVQGTHPERGDNAAGPSPLSSGSAIPQGAAPARLSRGVGSNSTSASAQGDTSATVDSDSSQPGRRGEQDNPFWESAEVPEPANPRQPSAAIAATGGGGLGDEVEPPLIDRAAEIRSLEALPPTEDNLRSLNDTTTVWYAESPEDAVAWLNETPRFNDVAPAVSSIASTIAESGFRDVALDWAETIEGESARSSALLDINKLAARNGLVTREQFASEGFTPEEIETFFLGD